MSGKVESDMHEDIIYVKAAQLKQKKVVLTNKDGSKIQVIKDSVILYDMLS